MVIGAIVGIIFLPESPKFLLAQKRYDEARDVLQKMARYNRAKVNV